MLLISMECSNPLKTLALSNGIDEEALWQGYGCWGENRVLRAHDGMTGIRVFCHYLIPAGRALSQVKIGSCPQSTQEKLRDGVLK
ncbi:hypothetical protein [Pseudomonas cerasi]